MGDIFFSLLVFLSYFTYCPFYGFKKDYQNRNKRHNFENEIFRYPKPPRIPFSIGCEGRRLPNNEVDEGKNDLASSKLGRYPKKCARNRWKVDLKWSLGTITSLSLFPPLRKNSHSPCTFSSKSRKPIISLPKTKREFSALSFFSCIVFSIHFWRSKTVKLKFKFLYDFFIWFIFVILVNIGYFCLWLGHVVACHFKE